MLLNGQRIDGKRPFEINRMGLSRSFQITNIFPKLSVFENLRCGVLWSLGYKYTFLKFLADLDDANERAEELLDMIKLDRKRDVLAINLTYAEQRALEIGITIAGGANVILLDEPTAGMSKSETRRFIELIKEVTVGKTLLTVEHDMGVVFGLADKIAVVVYGEVIAFDRPEAVRANQRVQEAYLGSHVADAQVASALNMLKIENLHAFYGKSHVLHGVHFDVGEGEIVALLGRNGSGRSTTAKAIMGMVECTGIVDWKGRHTAGHEALRDRAPGPGLRAREPRHLPEADGAPEPDARPEERAPDGPLDLRRHVRDVPAPEGAPAHRSRRAVGRRAADADAVPHADGRPRPDHHRRADRRAWRRRSSSWSAQYLQKLKQRGISVLLIEQKLTIAMAISDRALVMGHGSIVFQGTPDTLRADAYIRKEWLEV